jgi:hypothetical protein
VNAALELQVPGAADDFSIRASWRDEIVGLEDVQVAFGSDPRQANGVVDELNEAAAELRNLREGVSLAADVPRNQRLPARSRFPERNAMAPRSPTVSAG